MRKMTGFTLIEILIAMSIFAILAVITSTAMFNAFNIRSKLNEQADVLNAVQLSMSLIDRDIRQLTDRAIRGDDMKFVAALIGHSDYLEITRDGVTNPGSIEKRSTLKRMALICEKNLLIRRIWPRLDLPNRKLFEDTILLDKLTTCSFNYLDQNRQVLREWRENPTKGKEKTLFPIAVQLKISLTGWGDANLSFIIPEALYANP